MLVFLVVRLFLSLFLLDSSDSDSLLDEDISSEDLSSSESSDSFSLTLFLSEIVFFAFSLILTFVSSLTMLLFLFNSKSFLFIAF